MVNYHSIITLAHTCLGQATRLVSIELFQFISWIQDLPKINSTVDLELRTVSCPDSKTKGGASLVNLGYHKT